MALNSLKNRPVILEQFDSQSGDYREFSVPHSWMVEIAALISFEKILLSNSVLCDVSVAGAPFIKN